MDRAVRRLRSPRNAARGDGRGCVEAEEQRHDQHQQRDDLFWSAEEEVFRLSKQGGPSLPIGSARPRAKIRRLLVDEKTIYAAVADDSYATPKQILAFPKTGGCATVVYGGSESNHQPVQPNAIDDEYIYGVTRSEVVRISKVR